MEAIDFMREFGRMCEYYAPISCDKCKMSLQQNGTDLPCMKFAKQHPEDAVRIVEEFHAKHPPKTLRDLVLEKFPNADVMRFCPQNLWGQGVVRINNCSRGYRACWNRPAEEVEAKQ